MENFTINRARADPGQNFRGVLKVQRLCATSFDVNLILNL